MTINTRSVILFFGILLISLLLIGFCIGVLLYYFSNHSTFFTIRLSHVHAWWFFSSADSSISLLWILCGIFFNSLLAIISSLFFYYYFRKTSSAELFLFILFLITQGIDSIRVLQLFIQQYQWAASYSILLSRIIYANRMLGALLLFGASIFSLGVTQERLNISLGILFFGAFAFAYVVLFDPASYSANLLNHLEDSESIALVFIILELVTVLNFFRSSVSKSGSGQFMIAFAVILVLCGFELTFFLGNPLLIVTGLVCLTLGLIIYGRKNYFIHLSYSV